MKQIIILLIFLTPLCGNAQPCLDNRLSQLTNDSVKYWEDPFSGIGIAFYKNGNNYCEFEKGRFYTPERHNRRMHFDIRDEYVHLYADKELNYMLKMILEKDTIVGLYNENSHKILKVSNNQTKRISKTPMLRKGYVHSSFDKASYKIFQQKIDSLLKVYGLNEEKALCLLTSNKVVLKINAEGNVISCGFIKDGFVQEEIIHNYFEKAIIDLCYQIKCIPARDIETNETFESNLGTLLITKQLKTAEKE